MRCCQECSLRHGINRILRRARKAGVKLDFGQVRAFVEQSVQRDDVVDVLSVSFSRRCGDYLFFSTQVFRVWLESGYEEAPF